MMRFMLDTDIASFVIQGNHLALNAQIRKHAEQLCISAVTLAELSFGAVHSASPRILRAVHQFEHRLEVLPWSAEAAWQYGLLRKAMEEQGIPSGAMDMLIAAHALAEGATLVTHNIVHFSRVAGLNYCDWCA